MLVYIGLAKTAKLCSVDFFRLQQFQCTFRNVYYHHHGWRHNVGLVVSVLASINVVNQHTGPGYYLVGWVTACGLVNGPSGYVSALGLSNDKWRWWMWFLSSLQASQWLKSVGLVQRSADVWRCSAFIVLTG